MQKFPTLVFNIFQDVSCLHLSVE